MEHTVLKLFCRFYYCTLAVMITWFSGINGVSAQTITFSYTGTVQSWTVPAGVYSIAIDAQGATGGDGGNGMYHNHGGYGGRVQCTLSVSPGQIFNLKIGGAGGNGYGFSCCSYAGGYNGGGNSGSGYSGGGGGATDIRIGGVALSNRVIVAPGGGGAGYATFYTNYERGGGGGFTGENGYFSNVSGGLAGGQGGTQTGGGAGGTYTSPAGSAGSSGQGGNGGGGLFSGGGGGGYFGGGGGSKTGGGGGSSYANALYSSGAIYTSGYNSSGNGALIFNIFIYPITGTTSVCSGSTTALTDATPAGTWSSANTAVATVGASTGIVTGISPGTATISYTDGTRYATAVVTVNSAPFSISGPATVCAGAMIPLSDTITGGTWTSSNTAVATINPSSGVVTGVSGGTTMITYTLACGIATMAVTVNPSPSSISGHSSTCVGAATSLSDAMTGGIWTSSNPAIGTISSAGIVSAVSSGTINVSYTLTTGCYATMPLTVNPNPAAIAGVTTLCASSATSLSDAVSGGIWNSSNPSIATVNPITGAVSGLAGGYSVISYTLSTGCYSTQTVNVDPLPVVFTVTGGGSYCSGAGVHIYLSSSQAGVNYVLYNGVTPVITVSGTGSILDFGLSTSLGTFNAVATIAATGCSNNMAGAATITAGSPPAAIAGATTVCPGSASVFSDATSGGAWASSNTAVALVGSASGVVTGVSAGSAVISYNTSPGCYATQTVTVFPTLTPSVTLSITPGATVCSGSLAIFTAVPANGGTVPVYTWKVNGVSVMSSTASTYAFVPGNGDVTEVDMASSAACAVPAITTSAPITITVDTVGSITGTTGICLGATSVLIDGTPGGTWSSANPAIATIATIGGSTGVAVGLFPGTAVISYTTGSGCSATTTVSINPLPTVSASATPVSCGSDYALTATGGASYSWSPSTGLSCATCATTYISPAGSATFAVTATNVSGCSNTASVSVDGNRISGFISYTGGSSADSFKVWLIQFNPSDSSITALDSTYTCMDGGTPYYQFMDKASGSYMVKAKLLHQVTGASGYVPTYSFSTPHWYAAASVAHTGAWDTLHINMVYGVVPPGPGFIGGSVSAGAGRGTTGSPVEGMIVYLYNSSNQMLAFTYTDNTGAYSFGGLAYGTYYIYPEDFSFATIPSATITLNASAETVTGINFRKYLDSKVIKPLAPNSINAITNDGSLSIHPNPTNGYLTIQWKDVTASNAAVTVSDVVGRQVYSTSIATNKTTGETVIDLSGLTEGVYLLTIKGENMYYSGKLLKR
jgi:uncharacterized protein YjdB